MLISANYGYLFASASKNASTSIENALIGASDIALTRPSVFKHLPVGGIKRQFAEFFDTVAPYEDFLSFGIVRDPIRRAISKFNYRSTFKPKHKLYCGNLTFEEFVEEISGADPRPPAKVDLQAHFFGFNGKKPQVDVVLRVENMAEDAAPLGTRLGIDMVQAVTTTRRNENEVKRVSFSDLSSDTVTRLQKVFQRDIRFYDWVTKQSKTGWADGLAKPAPNVTREQVVSFFRSRHPEVYAESLLNQLRLDAHINDGLRREMSQEVLVLDPSRKADVERIFA